MTDIGLAQIKQEGSVVDYGGDASPSREKTSWLELVELEMTRNEDSPDAVIRTNGDTFPRFSEGFGGVYKAKWIVWTATYVYVPSIFDGMPSIVSVPREPSDYVYSIDELGI